MLKIISGLKNFYRKLGPGIVTGASDDDPSGILTYLQAGTIIGVKALWTALLTLPLMYIIQEMCARIGLVTQKGLIRLIKEHYSKYILYVIALISISVITINIGADLLAMSVVLEKLSPVSRFVWIPAIAIFILAFTIFFSYQKFARALKWLAFSLFSYVIVTFFLNIDWWSAIKSTFIPVFPVSQENILLVVAILGTTISPYLFFWQANEEAEERREKQMEKPLERFIVTKHELKFLKEDTFIGMFFSNLVMWFIILSASHLSSAYGLQKITNFDQAALVLKPLLGPIAYFIFSIGIVGVGLIAIPVLAGSIGYMFSEIFNWQEGIDKPFRKAKGFYLAIIMTTAVGMLISMLGFDPVQLLIYTAIFYALITPPLIYFIIRFASDPAVMKHKVNTRNTNILGWVTFAIVSLAVIFYIISLFL